MGEEGEMGLEWKWERLFGVGEGTHQQNVIKLTGKEFTIPP